MAKCPVLMPKRLKPPAAGQPTVLAGSGARFAPRALRNCGRDATHFYRVTYSRLQRKYDKSNKFEDVFGVCPEHGPTLADFSCWQERTWGPLGGRGRGLEVNGLRGSVGMVERIDAPFEDAVTLAAQDKIDRVASQFKDSIKRMMGQSNAARLTPDMWQKLMTDALEEFEVECVMRA